VTALKGAGAKVVSGFKQANSGKLHDPYTAYAAQAAQVLLDAIAKSNGTRGSVSSGLFGLDIKNGILGNFKIDANGDPEEASGAVVGFTIYRATDELTTETTVSPKPETVAAAGGKS